MIRHSRSSTIRWHQSHTRCTGSKRSSTPNRALSTHDWVNASQNVHDRVLAPWRCGACRRRQSVPPPPLPVRSVAPCDFLPQGPSSYLSGAHLREAAGNPLAVYRAIRTMNMRARGTEARRYLPNERRVSNVETYDSNIFSNVSCGPAHDPHEHA